jgi:cobalt-zinc-cadmium efflux system membrane fusion protein
MQKRILAAILAVAAVVIAATVVLWREPDEATSNEPAGPLDYPRGPHGARLLSADDLQVEVTIFESGVPPHFRVFPYDASGAPLRPADVQLTVELHRLGGRVDRMSFVPEADYLRGNGVVEEPHSFDVKVVAERNGRRHEWSYSQIEGKVQLSDDVLKSTGIEIQAVGPRTMTTVLEVPGQILADDTRVAHVVPHLSGVVLSVARRIGDAVQRGDVIAVVHSRELADARSAYLVATHQTEFARTTAAREEALWKKKISPEQEYLAAKHAFEEAELVETAAAQKLVALGDSPASLAALVTAPAEALPRFEVRAPLNGVVLERDVTVGEAIEADRTMFVIGDLSSVWVEATLSAADVGIVRMGQEATIRSGDLDQDVPGRVTYLSPRVDPETRRATARLAITNADGRWRPGLFVTVRLLRDTATVPMAVPAEAIQTFRDWQVVFFRFGDWFEARPLELGRTDGTWVEVLSGLQPGDRYAATNSFAIKAEIGKLGATHDH